jgi:transketolase
MGWDPDKQFYVPEECYAAASMKEDGAAAHAAWHERFAAWRTANPELAEEWDLAWVGKALPGLGDALRSIEWDKPKIATRSAGAKVMAAFEAFTPTMVGGAADLSESTKTEFPNSERFTAEKAGRNVFFGVREHGMGGAVNGMAAHGGIVRPYGSTFMQFADYMRGAIRLSALTGLPSAWVFTHDSVALGEDGPTHQPVEHLAALRAIPGLVVLRPGDAHETAEAWRVILEDLEGPAALVLSRQDLPVLDRETYGSAEGVSKGAYVLSDPGDAEAIIIGTGSEVSTALAAAAELDVPVRVVSMPSWELFEQQDEDYKTAVLPIDLPTVCVEAGVRMGWERYADAIVSIDRFGASAPGEKVLEEFGITPANVAAHVRRLLR